MIVRECCLEVLTRFCSSNILRVVNLLYMQNKGDRRGGHLCSAVDCCMQSFLDF